MDKELRQQIEAVREFNRFYTNYLGLLREKHLDSPVTLAEARIMYEIHQTPGVTAASLMNRLGLDRGYLSRLIGKLEKTVLVARLPNPNDNRSRILYLSDKGAELIAGLIDQTDLQLQAIIQGLAVPDREKLIGAMADIKAVLS